MEADDGVAQYIEYPSIWLGVGLTKGRFDGSYLNLIHGQAESIIQNRKLKMSVEQ